MKSDRDRDGLTNESEIKRTRTKPDVADTDRDGLSDGTEVNRTKTNPRKADTDGDRLGDGLEVNRYRTNPRQADSDGDGVNDGAEVRAGTDPLKAPGAPTTPRPPRRRYHPPRRGFRRSSRLRPRPTRPRRRRRSRPGPRAAPRRPAPSSRSARASPARASSANSTPAASPPAARRKRTPGSTVGSHTFSVRATDAAGNTDASPASRTWTVTAVTPPVPAAAVWDSPKDAKVNQPVALDGSASTGVAPVACTWSFENQDGSVVYDTRSGCRDQLHLPVQRHEIHRAERARRQRLHRRRQAVDRGPAGDDPAPDRHDRAGDDDLGRALGQHHGDRRRVLVRLERVRLELPVQTRLRRLRRLRLAENLLRADGRQSHLLGAGNRRRRQHRRQPGEPDLDGRGGGTRPRS